MKNTTKHFRLCLEVINELNRAASSHILTELTMLAAADCQWCGVPSHSL